MARRILDEGLMEKIAQKTGKRKLTDVNVMVSRKASKLGVSPEAALILIAKEQGIGTAVYQRSLDISKQAQVRDALPAMFAGSATPAIAKKSGKAQVVVTNKRANLRLVIEYLIQDAELRSRCTDLLLAGSKFDRAINQATLILEERIRVRAQPTTNLVGEPLVNFAFKEDLATTVLQVAGGNAEEQRGFTQILRGAVPAFRNRTHHHILDAMSREDAMRVCGFIDVLLRVVDGSVKLR